MVTHAIAPKLSRGALDLNSGRRSIPSHFHVCAFHNKELKDSDSEQLQPFIGSSSHQYRARHRYFPPISLKIINLYTSHAKNSDHRSFYTWTTIRQRKDVGSNPTTNRMLALNPSNTIQMRFFAAKKRDFYEVLGVAKGSDKATIKKAYFNLAKKYHPDTNKVRFLFRHKNQLFIHFLPISLNKCSMLI